MDIKDLQGDQSLDRADMEAIAGGLGRNVLGAAFKVGWKVGTALDSEYGISDAIAGTDDYAIITDDVKNAGNPQ